MPGYGGFRRRGDYLRGNHTINCTKAAGNTGNAMACGSAALHKKKDAAALSSTASFGVELAKPPLNPNH